MRTASSASARPRTSRLLASLLSTSLLFLPQAFAPMAAAQAPFSATATLPLRAGASLSCTAEASATLCRVATPSHRSTPVILQRDTAVRQPTALSLRRVASFGHVVILVDTYPSASSGLQRCQAGTESFLRVLTIARDTPAETFHTPLESCTHSTELALDGIRWNPATHQLSLHWLSSPQTGQESRRTLQVQRSGRVTSTPAALPPAP